MPPLDLDPMPDPAYPAGWPIGDSDASGTDYEVQELLHRPHAFALMHGDNGAKIAYGQLHWRVDCFTLQFKVETLPSITVADHPYWDHTHYDHPAHTHEHDHYHTTRPHTHIINPDTHDGHNSTGTSGGSMGGTWNTGSGGGTVYTHSHGGATGSAVTESGSTQSPDDATTGDPSAALTHNTVRRPALTHTVTHTPATITYCDQAKQEAIGDINVEVPTLGSADGEGMDATIPNIYHELGEYGDVYLVWIVDLEDAGGEVQDCWVQVGEPDGSQISEITMGNAATNRRNASDPSVGTGEPEAGDDTGVFKILLGTVNLNDQIIQNVSSDVNWTTTVMDRSRP